MDFLKTKTLLHIPQKWKLQMVDIFLLASTVLSKPNKQIKYYLFQVVLLCHINFCSPQKFHLMLARFYQIFAYNDLA